MRKYYLMKELCCRKSEEAIKNGQYRDTSNIFKKYKDKDCQEKNHFNY